MNNSASKPGSDQTLWTLTPILQFAYEQEDLLLTKIKLHNLHELNEILNTLMDYVLLSGRNPLLNSKARISELNSVFTRILIEAGISSPMIAQLHTIYRQALEPLASYDTLCKTAQQMAAHFVQCIQSPGSLSGSQAAMCQAQGFIARHYASKLTLQETAGYVHLNSAYFSSVFKQLSGISFKEYLNRIRIEESKRLLTETSYDIIDIVVATGFEDQSYFTKTFRKYTGSTPGQFRTARRTKGGKSLAASGKIEESNL